MSERGLIDAGADGHVVSEGGGEGVSQAMAANARQRHDGLLAVDVTSEDIDRFIDVLADPEHDRRDLGARRGAGRRPT